MSPRLTAFVVVALFQPVVIQQAASGTMPDGQTQHTTYSGSLIQPGEGDGEILRRFEAELYTNGSRPSSRCPTTFEQGARGQTALG